MNTHDIELPPMPLERATLESGVKVYAEYTLRQYARDAIKADRKRRGEPVAWLYEDELPDNYPYEAMFPYSKVDGVRMFPVYATQPADPDGTLIGEGTKSDDPVGGEYPSNEWVTAFFGSPDDSGFYYFRGDFGNIAHRYKNSAKHLLPQLADPVVKESLTVPDGWKLVPIKPTEAMLNQGESEWSSRYEANRGYRAMLQAAPTYSGAPKRLQDMSKAELIDLIESERDKHHQELEAIGAGEW